MEDHWIDGNWDITRGYCQMNVIFLAFGLKEYSSTGLMASYRDWLPKIVITPTISEFNHFKYTNIQLQE